jgi:hypothetical protein
MGAPLKAWARPLGPPPRSPPLADLIPVISPPDGFLIRRMTRPELDLVFDWVAAERWNPGLHDAECLWRHDPNGLFIGELNREPVAALAAIAYGATLGFLGYYLVRPGFRGRGCGLLLWQAALVYLGDRNLGLDAVPDQEANYRKSGFRAAYRHLYFLGRGGGLAPAGLTPLSAEAWEEVLAYDRPFFPAPRPDFLRCWLSRPGGAALGAVREGRLAGYGVIRPCHRGFKVGPLFADDAQVAMDLFQGLIAGVPHAPVILNVPEVNPGALDLAERFGLQPVFATTRMYTRGEPGVPLGRVYGHDLF